MKVISGFLLLVVLFQGCGKTYHNALVFSVSSPPVNMDNIRVKYLLARGEKKPYSAKYLDLIFKGTNIIYYKNLQPDTYRVKFEKAFGYGDRFFCINDAFVNHPMGQQRFVVNENSTNNLTPVQFVWKINFDVNPVKWSMKDTDKSILRWNSVVGARRYIISINKFYRDAYGISHPRTILFAYNIKTNYIKFTELLKFPMIEVANSDPYLTGFTYVGSNDVPILLMKKNFDVGEYWVNITAHSSYTKKITENVVGISGVRSSKNLIIR